MNKNRFLSLNLVQYYCFIFTVVVVKVFINSVCFEKNME